MSNGIIFFNQGLKCLPRLITSLNSLKKVYSGNISIISVGNDSNGYVKDIANYFQIDCKLLENTEISSLKHSAFFEKSRQHLYTPYDNTIFLDSDTIVLKDISELFPEIEKHHFIVPQFANWKTSKGIIQSRLKEYYEWYPELIDECIRRNGPSVNVGVFGFR